MQPCFRISRICALSLSLAGLSFPAFAQVTPYGSGINPANSLVLTAGVPQTGASFQLSVKDTAATNPLPGQAYLFLASQPAPGFPAGLVLPGLGLGSPGSNGELLLDALPPNPFLSLGPALYPGGTSAGADFSLNVPSNPALVGFDIFAQGLLVTDSQGLLLGLTNALQITLGAPTGPIPGVTPIPGLEIIQPGTFMMGTNAASGWPYYGPIGPVHQVTISQPFWMAQTEVTQAEYQALMGTNPSFYVGPNKPVESLYWSEAQAYCAALNSQQAALGNVPAGYQYRMATEAEWEYACRAGTTTEFNVGSDLFCDQARIRYSYHSISECIGWDSGSVPVGSYLANAWGLYDMHGNVWEWCSDSPTTYTAAPVTDPYYTGGLYHNLRGGSWLGYSNLCRSATRNFYFYTFRASYVGFRVVLAPILVP
jgi:formylglycine-generating enzyme required for sulfatase activity